MKKQSRPTTRQIDPNNTGIGQFRLDDNGDYGHLWAYQTPDSIAKQGGPVNYIVSAGKTTLGDWVFYRQELNRYYEDNVGLVSMWNDWLNQGDGRRQVDEAVAQLETWLAEQSRSKKGALIVKKQPRPMRSNDLQILQEAADSIANPETDGIGLYGALLDTADRYGVYDDDADALIDRLIQQGYLIDDTDYAGGSGSRQLTEIGLAAVGRSQPVSQRYGWSDSPQFQVGQLVYIPSLQAQGKIEAINPDGTLIVSYQYTFGPDQVNPL